MKRIETKKLDRRGGFSIIEVMIAASITGVILVGIYMMWGALAKEWMTERVKSTLNEELQVDITAMKKDLRLSSSTEVFYASALGSPPYQAIAFPIPIDEDGDNLIEMDEDDNIIWDRTIVYHTFTNAEGVTELRKTVFNPRDTTLTSAERQEQVDAVLEDGDGSGTHNSANAATTVLFEGIENFEIMPALVTFNGYSDVLERSDYVRFGSVLLTSGEHTLRFEVTGKAALSSDHKFAIDAIVMSPSGGKREAEELPVEGSSGDLAENIDLSLVGSWSGYAHLLYNANAVGDYIELTVYHDEWIETNFDDANSTRDGIDIEFISDLDPPEIVARLDGMRDTWLSETATGGASAGYTENPPTLPTLRDLTVRAIVSSETLSTKGARVRALFRAHPLSNQLQITSAYIEERSSGQDGVSATKQQLYFSNGPVVVGTEDDMELGTIGSGPASVTIPAGQEVYSNWADLAIDTEKDYLVTFHIADVDNSFSASYFPGLVGAVNSYYRTGDHAADSAWSGAGTNFEHSVGLVKLQATHPAMGTWTSQIVDTKMSNPPYGELSWVTETPVGTQVKIYLRSSDDAEMDDNPAWTEFATSPSEIGETFTGRYVQLKTELFSPDPYFDTPYLLKSSVRWEGDETLVDIGGYFSLDDDYGTIKLTVDGQELAKSVEVSIRAMQEYLGRQIRSTISAEIEPRNTAE